MARSDSGGRQLSTLRQELDRAQLRDIEHLPGVLADQNLGFTWNAVEAQLPPALRHDTAQILRRFLHADFVKGYLQEYGLRVLTNLPFGWRDLGVQPLGGYFDYGWLEVSLRPLGVLDLLVDLDAPSLLALRAEEGFIGFQELYRQACDKVPTTVELRRAFTQAATGLSKAKQQLLATITGRSTKGIFSLNDEAVQALAFILAEGAGRVAERLEIVASGTPDPLRGDYRLYLEQIDEFTKIRAVPPGDVLSRLKAGRIELSEEAVQLALEEILAVPFHKKDWGGEVNDLYSANLHIRGRRLAAAFLLKGNGLKAAEMQIRDCGKNGDQLLRLVDSPAQLFVVQYVGPIAEAVIRDMDLKIRALRASSNPASYCIIDGQDTARLLRAHGKL